MAELTEDFHTIRGSDLPRDAMILELIDTKVGDEVAEIVCFDSTGDMTISIFRPDMPLDVIERFIQRAKNDLPPVEQ